MDQTGLKLTEICLPFHPECWGLKATIPGLHLPFETEFFVVLEHAGLPLPSWSMNP